MDETFTACISASSTAMPTRLIDGRALGCAGMSASAGRTADIERTDTGGRDAGCDQEPGSKPPAESRCGSGHGDRRRHPSQAGPSRGCLRRVCFMERLDNPAGRLHAALTAFHTHAIPNVSVQEAWSRALEVQGDDVWATLGEVATLLPRIERALIASDNADQLDAFRHWQALWAWPIFAPDRPFGNESTGLVDSGALQALSSMSSLLSRTASEGYVPNDEKVQSLRVKLDEAIERVLADDDLPADLRQILLRRLHEMIWALDHVRVVGPDGVQAVAELLVVNVGMPSEEHRHGPTVRVVFEVAGTVWAAFSSVAAIRNSIDAGHSLLQMLES